MKIRRFENLIKTRIANFFTDLQTLFILLTVIKVVDVMTQIMKDAKPEDLYKAVQDYERKHPHDN